MPEDFHDAETLRFYTWMLEHDETWRAICQIGRLPPGAVADLVDGIMESRFYFLLFLLAEMQEDYTVELALRAGLCRAGASGWKAGGAAEAASYMRDALRERAAG